MAPGARAPGVEGGLDGGFVAFLDFGFSGGVVHGGQSEEAAEDEEESGFMRCVLKGWDVCGYAAATSSWPVPVMTSCHSLISFSKAAIFAR
jgi:hypothetical protein